MKKISYTELKRGGSQGKGRTAKRRQPKAKNLNITSLIDILTILLIFLIQNVSMEAQKSNPPEGMELPSSASIDSLVTNGQVVIIKVYGKNAGTYPDGQVLFGTSSTPVGNLDSFVNDPATRNAMLFLLKEQAAAIMASATDAIPVILIQADNNVENRYITEIVKVSGSGDFGNIYFSSIRAVDLWTDLTDS
ncbi:MAG: biopolymer transporter ExbD [Candidatus Cloacimonetes bacterium]|nr:biopolymer transporter ExbD [Candidatus Cloacimonadota bacterium]